MIEVMRAKHRARILREILIRERNYLLHGRLHELAGMAGQADQALAALMDIRPETAKRIEDDINAIRAEATRNEALAGASLRGVKAAMEQFKSLTNMQGGLGVYTSAGCRVDLPAEKSDKFHRA